MVTSSLLQSYVATIRRYQRLCGLSQVALVKSLPELGSVRSWRRIDSDNWAGLNLIAWESRLCAAAQQARLLTPAEPASTNPIQHHLAEADRARTEGFFGLALGHCYAAQTLIHSLQFSTP